ncbi:VOC family protein [Kitasatospora sp. NPDC006697]|uniref:VOC family protein n=1 Tax=Kitasatospora sp. NPDC006697 TaxID=3364020 RepID=UPI00368E4874
MIRWVYAFVDRPHDGFTRAAEFWTAVTGTALSPRRGADGEFATFLPEEPGTDAFLKLQGVGEPVRGAHLDLCTDDVPGLADRATALGATVTADYGTLVVFASPAGLPFCVVAWQGEHRRPGVFRETRADQLAIDVAADLFEEETRFWAALTDWPLYTGSQPEFRVLQSPPELPVRLLLHRLDEPRPVGAHLDLACTDVAATRAAHRELGAQVLAEHPRWTAMRDPAGGTYCLTGRDPRTGRVPV